MVSNHSVSEYKANILVVDDDLDTCQILALLLRAKGFQSQTAISGKEGLELLGSQEFDLVLLDVMMPDMDGWETYRQIRMVSKIPVLFVTALQQGEDAVRALRIGAQDFVRKPFYQAELLERIEKSLANARILAMSNSTAPLQRPTVSLVIPTLNEEKNLPLVLPYLPLDWIDEVILVDGRSTDKTVEVAQEILPSIKIVFEQRRGKGIAMRAGYHAASGEIIIVMDADGSNDPREIPRFVQALMSGADFVKGSRFAHGGGTTDMPRIRQWGNRFFVTLVNVLFNQHFTDLCYGYHAFWRFCLDSIPLEDMFGFEIDTALYLRAAKQRLKVVEVPSFEGYRFFGVGKLRAFPDGVRVLKTILREVIGSKLPAVELYMGFRGFPPVNGPLEHGFSVMANSLDGTFIQVGPGSSKDAEVPKALEPFNAHAAQNGREQVSALKRQ
jgi:CheY-like chemotaxis protein